MYVLLALDAPELTSFFELQQDICQVVIEFDPFLNVAPDLPIHVIREIKGL